MVFYTITIFLSAFLLFQIQPIMAKMILPWFGGSSAVWSTCMLFFQMALLLGYVYAHWLHERLVAGRQAVVHMALLAASLLALPAIPNPSWRPSGAANPSFLILGLLAVTIGLPYFLLSTTSPLLQAWYARSHKGAVPYRLFALSNLASLLALLSYPPLVEPNLATRAQALGWSAAYAAFVLLCGATAWRTRAAAAAPVEARVEEEVPVPPAGRRLLWMALAACASILFLAVTTYLTQDVAAVPFLWILPLSLYLLSFIVCFDAPRWYRRGLFLPLLAIALMTMTWLSWVERRPHVHMEVTIAIFAGALFVCSMVCHGELARLKPHPRYLTVFYVMVSVGGAVGGLFVSLVAPAVFNAYYEFPIGMGLCATLAVAVLLGEAGNRSRRRPWKQLLLAGLGAYLVFLVYVSRNNTQGYHLLVRNFYGTLAVYDDGAPDEEGAARKLLHGTINHGQQMLDPAYRRQPVSYFCPDTGIGRAMRARSDGVPWRIGILGLGCGTLAAYGRAGDVIRIFEINPAVLELAHTQFTYLADTPARVEVALGDGRLSVEHEPERAFDILVMDAFSGDSVPVHLITREAFQTYFRHLKPGGILAVNISNRYLDLRPVMAQAAHGFGKVALLYDYSPKDDDDMCFSCSWVLLMDPATRASAPPLLLATAKELRPQPGFRMWTDDFSNLLQILK
jgi:SAM-dependent methyltransferase